MEVWVKFFSEGFFGYAEKGNFKYYSLAHFIPIILLALAIYLTHRYRDKLKNWKHEENLRFIFAFVMLLAAMALICNFNIEGANYLYLARGTTDGGGSIMDVLIKIAPNVWARLAFLTVVVLAMFFLAYGVYRGICKLSSKKSEHKAKIPV